MSELIQKNDSRATIRWKLLTGASALALTAYVSSVGLAHAENSDRSEVWIELGGQLSRLQDGQEAFTPPFVSLTPPNFSSPQDAERPPLYGIDESASIVFQPEGSNWHFSASIRYGRASTSKQVHHQSSPSPYIKYHINRKGVKFYGTVRPSAARFTDAVVKQSDVLTIVDFEVGKDVGLGLFGAHDTSSLNLGTRFAQFQSKSRIALREDPDWHFVPRTFTGRFNHFFELTAAQVFHSYAGTLSADRSFRGVGPSLSWSSSTPFAGNVQDGELTFDFGANGAVLFGRQRAKVHHQTTALYQPLGTATAGGPRSYTLLEVTYQHPAVPHTRSRNVVVPNIGGFAGISLQYTNAKVSLGYKADFFFGAIDGGIDARKNESRGFFGPFASISIGLGD